MIKSKFKRVTSLFLATLMCVTTFAGIGSTTAYAASGEKIDLVKGVDGTVEIVDFKSERKPDMVKMRERLEHYRRQLQIYAYLIEQRTGQKVSKMHLYYTGEENGNPMITYPYTRTAIEGTVAAFDDTVHKILRKDFKHRCDDAKTCKNCDFRYYCNK